MRGMIRSAALRWFCCGIMVSISRESERGGKLVVGIIDSDGSIDIH